ncbi:OmpA family protein [Polaribacter sp. Asnod1-A03]|uniref:OmpA family protein n=1 Tax=Polaribacter sp. Asnod1-A03 TaxID=3160581 RepID=UPI00386AD6D2
MRRIFLLTVLTFLITAKSYAQFTTNEITYARTINLENSNSWAVGGGFSNFIMHGDMRSIGTSDDTNYLNFGVFAYVDKMFNPLLGLEFKATYSKISGGAQYFSDVYELLYVDNTVIRDNMRFEGKALGAELNLILNFTNLYQTSTRNWNAAGYFGVGYHQYDSALYEINSTGEDNLLVDFGHNEARNSVSKASSIYLSGQFGLKRRISKRVDLEFRTGIYFNYEDHLDAAISNKQDWETFFVTSIGAVVKLGKKKVFAIWGDDKQANTNSGTRIKDTDKDGVMDQLDVEPNTPAGVLVYGNGKAIDSDQDGLPDYQDKCPLIYGAFSNEGCPVLIDTDKDGITDDKDACPNTPGVIENNGCPKQATTINNNINQQINLLAASINFNTNSDKIKPVSYTTIDEIITLMKKIPDVKFLIEGHTDDVGNDNYNLDLSKRRAASVVKYMIEQGIPKERLESKGFGKSRPKFSNDTEGGRQLNRRVEIKTLDS